MTLGISLPELTLNELAMQQKYERGEGGLHLMLMLWVGMCIAVHISSTNVLFLLSPLRNNMTGSSVHNQHYPYRVVVHWNFSAELIVNTTSFLKLACRLPLLHTNFVWPFIAACFLTLHSQVQLTHASFTIFPHWTFLKVICVKILHFLLSKLKGGV